MPWWLPLVQGIALLIVGVLLFTNPGATAVVLVQVLALYWFLSGIFQIVSIFIDHSAWGWKLIAGIIGIWAGVYILQHPIAGTLAFGLALIVILGVMALMQGTVNIIQAFRGGGWGIGVLGVINIIFGFLLLGNRWIATATLPWVLGGFAIVGGIAAIYMAFKLRKS